MIKERLKTILKHPNSLTMLRVIAAPFVVVLMLEPSRLTAFFAAMVFGLAAVTDYLDGFLARRYGMVSNLGKVLDPVADKLMISFVLISLSALEWIPAWVACLIIGRELAVTGLRSIVAQNKLDVSASTLGKYKTGFQIAALIPLLLHFPLYGFDFHAIGMFLMWFALFFTLWSGVDYFVRFKGLLNL